MFDSIKRAWAHFRKKPPGQRFKARYHEQQRSRRSPLAKLAVMASGLVIIALGIFFIPAPGPGFLIVFVGGGLIAEESLPIARALDWIDLKLHEIHARLAAAWSGARSPAIVPLLSVFAAIAVIALAFGVYLFLGHSLGRWD